eukprot:sb/3467010/
MSERRNTFGYVHGKSYLKPSSPDLKDFWTFHEKFQKLSKRKPPSSSSTQNHPSSSSLGIPTGPFDRSHTVPFVCVSTRDEQEDPGRAAEFHNSLRHFVRFKSKQSYGKVIKQIEYQKELPIYKFKSEIIRTVNRNSISIIAGDTGCGKSTQVAQYLLEAGYESIACTQPRRIACVSLATRVAMETFNKYGQDIGYQVRFDQMLYSKTKLRFLTEGLLLRQLQNDPDLHGYDLVILDELKGFSYRKPKICCEIIQKEWQAVSLHSALGLPVFRSVSRGPEPEHVLKIYRFTRFTNKFWLQYNIIITTHSAKASA